MDGAGFVAILAGGSAALLVAALADRRTRKKAETERPGVDDPEAIPEYVTDEQLARGSHSLRARARAEAPIPIPDGAIRLPLRLIDDRLGVGPDKRSTVENARVLVCVDGISSMRELLPVLRLVAASGEPLVIAAATVENMTADTLVANHQAGKVALQVLGDDSPDGAPLADLAAIAHATPVSYVDLRAGDVADADLGYLAFSCAAADPPETFVLDATVA
jgi:hypothetical protein